MKVETARAQLIAKEVLAIIEHDPNITHMTFELVDRNGKKAVSISSSKEPKIIVL